MVDLTSVVGNLQRLGFFDFVLPWLLFFALIRAILDKTDIIGKEASINSIVAAVIAFFIVNFTPIGGISAFYSKTFGMSAMVIATLLVFVLFAGVLGYTPDKLIADEKQKKWIYPLIAVIFAVLAFAVFTQATGGSLSFIGLGSDTLTLLLVLIFVLAVIFFASNE